MVENRSILVGIAKLKVTAPKNPKAKLVPNFEDRFWKAAHVLFAVNRATPLFQLTRSQFGKNSFKPSLI
ncbi:hypothetical protein AGR3A_Cc420236 [Agrobacterium tomkonis CFBP 6623]|uniref:Uncharacterized protein n=1 Tax=Agrobacterium tomkonis CFBP 6623 TaxID=1183432 RepID=A0A1S7QCL9_9HYPH|nr:hypothetical protein AGR3A_Cc420236 [Agrobacterium tomkonis CFBP 6623]